MIELKQSRLEFTFPKVFPDSHFSISFQRTLRIPDDNKSYPLPPGFGAFPLRHVDDYADSISPSWIDHGGVMMPMYQSEALWISFNDRWIEERQATYPFAIKIAAGKINAVTGKEWSNGLHDNPQDYMVSAEQPWLDGYCVEKGYIRQFVAMPLGAGYTAEEQIKGTADVGGMQIIVYPMKKEVFEKRFPIVPKDKRNRFGSNEFLSEMDCCCAAPAAGEMGLAPGGRMKQEIFEDPFDINDWDTENYSRCFVHLANSLVWRQITGEKPPTVPPTAKEYANAGLPWFDYYDDTATPLEGSETLKDLKSVAQLGKEKSEVPLPENQSVDAKDIIELRKHLKKDQIREGRF